MEIQLNKAILFNKGYVLQTSNNLQSNILYYLKIQTDNNEYNKIYTSIYNNNTILDIWGTTSIPQGTNVCFTLTDELPQPPCEPSICDFIINQP